MPLGLVLKTICAIVEVMRSPIVLKQNSSRQRGDVLLTKEIAGALVQRVLSGETLYPSEGRLELLTGDEEGERTIILSCNTLHTWVKRGNVISETGKELRAVLDKAREDYRTRKAKEMDRERLAIIDAKLNRVISLRTKEPVIDALGLVKDKNGNTVKKENPHLLRIQTDTVKWLAERLDPDRYGKVSKEVKPPLVFSLSELRRAAAEQDKKMPVSE